METKEHKLVVGDLLVLSSSMIGLVNAFNYQNREAEPDFYVVGKIGRKYYHLIMFNRVYLAYQKRVLIDMDTLDGFIEMEPKLVSKIPTGGDEYIRIREKCIQDSTARLKVLKEWEKNKHFSRYQYYVDSFLELLYCFDIEKGNAVVAKFLLTV